MSESYSPEQAAAAVQAEGAQYAEQVAPAANVGQIDVSAATPAGYSDEQLAALIEQLQARGVTVGPSPSTPTETLSYGERAVLSGASAIVAELAHVVDKLVAKVGL